MGCIMIKMEIFDFRSLLQSADSYCNVVASQVNNHVVRISIMTEAYFWHYHPNSDETFLCMEGILLIDTPAQTLRLEPGQLFTVPANMHHRTRPEGDRSVNITFELKDMETIKLA